MKYATKLGLKPGQILLCLAAPLLLLHPGATPARAGDSDTKIRFVDTADLNLQSPEGQEELDRRIARAARHVCEPIGISSAGYAACTRRAKQEARPLSMAVCLPGEGPARSSQRIRPASLGPRAPLVAGN